MHNGEIHLSSCWVGIYARAPVIMSATYYSINFGIYLPTHQCKIKFAVGS